MDGLIMVELDGGRNMRMSALETVTIAKACLQRQGVAFRTLSAGNPQLAAYLIGLGQ